MMNRTGTGPEDLSNGRGYLLVCFLSDIGEDDHFSASSRQYLLDK